MNNYKKIVVVAFLFATTLFYGQNKPDWEKIKTLKIAFLTERLNLNSKEAQAFWPVYNDYEAKRESLREKGHTQIRSKLKDSENLSETEASKLLDQFIKYEEEEEELDKNFLTKISKVISAKKTLLLLRSEEDFKRQLIKQYHEKNKGNK
tara:strand:- start:123377 stop:123826 length:450 start_codon:yes stop_codon:yes gene_type:complete